MNFVHIILCDHRFKLKKLFLPDMKVLLLFHRIYYYIIILLLCYNIEYSKKMNRITHYPKFLSIYSEHRHLFLMV